jgi:hypothetical protein
MTSRAVDARDTSNLTDAERIHFRDRVREARYTALADAEGFQQICFALEALGKRLDPKADGLGKCRQPLEHLARRAGVLDASGGVDGTAKSFSALFTALKEARNDMAHTGAYARHVAADGVALCLMLEEALMSKRLTVGDFMVSTPVTVQLWQTLAYARQLILANSFTYLPIWDERDRSWALLSDLEVAKYLGADSTGRANKNHRIEEARAAGLTLTRVHPVRTTDAVADLLKNPKPPGLWLVTAEGYPEGHLVGVLSPFELL